MTTTQKLATTTALTITIGAGIYEISRATHARAEAHTLRQQQTAITSQLRQLQDNYANVSNRIATLLTENSVLKSNSDQTELLKLRGEVGVMRRQLADDKDPSSQVQQPPLASALEYLRRGQTHAFNHEYEAALADFNQAIELDPTMAEAYVERGDLYASDFPKERGGEEQAMVDYSRCLEIDPNDASARWNRATYEANSRKPNEAIADWTAFIEGDTDFSHQVEDKTKMLASAHFYRGRTYQWNLHEPAKAIADYTAALQLNPNIEEAHRMRGQCYKTLGELDLAQQDFAVEPENR